MITKTQCSEKRGTKLSSELTQLYVAVFPAVSEWAVASVAVVVVSRAAFGSVLTGLQLTAKFFEFDAINVHVEDCRLRLSRSDASCADDDDHEKGRRTKSIQLHRGKPCGSRR